MSKKPADPRIQTCARFIAAQKMGLRKDPHGLNLPDDLWMQAIDAATAAVESGNYCPVCRTPLLWQHDHQPGETGLDDGPPLPHVRKKHEPKSPEEYRRIRAEAWATRRAKYGARGHR